MRHAAEMAVRTVTSMELLTVGRVVSFSTSTLLGALAVVVPAVVMDTSAVAVVASNRVS